jgi:hypothetical protein
MQAVEDPFGVKVTWAPWFLRDWWSPDETVKQVRTDRTELSNCRDLDEYDRAYRRSAENELALLTINLEAADDESDLLPNFE